MMNVFSRMCFVSVAGMVLLWGVPTACADGGEKQAESKAVTSETRQRIVETLLDVVRDVDEQTGMRAAAARSLGTRASNFEAIQEKLRQALLEIVKAKQANPRLKIAAIEVLRESDVKLTKDDLTAIGQALWTILAQNDGTNDEERFLRAVSAREIAQYLYSDNPISGPKRIEGVQALLEMSVNSDQFRVSSDDGSITSSQLADYALATLNESENGIRALIEALAALNMKFDAKREKLAHLIKNSVPKTEGIAQVLLKAASHENPDVRVAAIEALGNEIPESDPGAAPITPPAPE